MGRSRNCAALRATIPTLRAKRHFEESFSAAVKAPVGTLEQTPPGTLDHLSGPGALRITMPLVLRG